MITQRTCRRRGSPDRRHWFWLSQRAWAMTSQQNDIRVSDAHPRRDRARRARPGRRTRAGADRRGAGTQGKRLGRQPYDIASERFEAVDHL